MQCGIAISLDTPPMLLLTTMEMYTSQVIQLLNTMRKVMCFGNEVICLVVPFKLITLETCT